MFGVKAAFHLIVCSFASGLTGTDYADLGDVFVAIPRAFDKLSHYIDLVQHDRLYGYNMRNAVPLEPPRVNYGIKESEIIYYLQHALIAFCSQNFVDEKFCYCQGKFQDTKIYNNKTMESRAAVAVDPLNNHVVVSYRLSVASLNWETNEENDLVNYPTPDGQEMVHRGHLKYFRSIQQATEDRVLELFNDPRFKDFNLHVTGYSLGGSVTAISMPAWLDFLKRNKLSNKPQFFAYSSPRPGNLAFAQYIESLNVPLVRYAKKGDIVPSLPDQSMGYSQAGQEFYDPGIIPNVPTHLKKCSPHFIQDKNCSLSDTIFFAPEHLLPFNKPFPTPPFC
ncbi:hypothetical protein DSO57_1025275 [Entomophthora muscae]|uniref:Uncharacterized protein n=1 Tax=Entomophthora muscae TaxID=34485 RepID=A0ACC2TDP0_9FUNG|nr:hypothetical protein DSO57_1025275 [Entomophthora muscae]